MKLSILIRNLNEARPLKQTLCSLKKQQTDFEYEVVVIDNESDDDSVQIAEQMGCKIFTLKREAFTFGHALNFGIKKCEGEIVLILSAHIILINEFFLQNIPQYFNNPKVAAARFTQCDSAEHVVRSLQNGIKELDSNAINFVNENWKNFIVNHCAAIRRSCAEEINFNEHVFASEDKLWSIEILKKGYSILYNVPCFYLYAKPFDRSVKLKREIIEQAAKELITGKAEQLFSAPYIHSFFMKLALGFKRLSYELKNHKHVYKGIKEYKKKYKSEFSMKNKDKFIF